MGMLVGPFAFRLTTFNMDDMVYCMPKSISNADAHDHEEFQKCSLQACVSLIWKQNHETYKRGHKMYNSIVETQKWLNSLVGQIVYVESATSVLANKTIYRNSFGMITDVPTVTTAYPVLEILLPQGLSAATAANVYIKYS